MSNLLLAAQILKIMAGIAQLAFAIWLVASQPRDKLNTAFAFAFGLNGIAYALFNIGMPGQRRAGSLAVEGRAALNWLAAVAMLIFAVLVFRMLRDRRFAVITTILVMFLVLSADLLTAREHHLSLMAFGGIAIYPATALALSLFPVAFANTSGVTQMFSAFLAAALAINSVDHLGAELLQPSPASLLVLLLQVGAMLVLLALWLRNMSSSAATALRLCVLVAACFTVPFLAGLLVRLAAGSYVRVQQSGFVGVGRLVATSLLFYGGRKYRIFQAPRLERAV